MSDALTPGVIKIATNFVKSCDEDDMMQLHKMLVETALGKGINLQKFDIQMWQIWALKNAEQAAAPPLLTEEKQT